MGVHFRTRAEGREEEQEGFHVLVRFRVRNEIIRTGCIDFDLRTIINLDALSQTLYIVFLDSRQETLQTDIEQRRG
jgi:hypothetical protein